MNLYRPVQAAQDIWRGTDPDRSLDESEVPSSALIGVWWTAWLIMNAISNISFRMTVNSPKTLEIATIGYIADEVATIIAAGFALAVVIQLDSRISARLAATEADENGAPESIPPAGF